MIPIVKKEEGAVVEEYRGVTDGDTIQNIRVGISGEIERGG